MHAHPFARLNCSDDTSNIRLASLSRSWIAFGYRAQGRCKVACASPSDCSYAARETSCFQTLPKLTSTVSNTCVTCRVKTDAFVQGLRREYSSRHRHGRHNASTAFSIASSIVYVQPSAAAAAANSQAPALQAQDWEATHSAALPMLNNQLLPQGGHTGQQQTHSSQVGSKLQQPELNEMQLQSTSEHQQQQLRQQILQQAQRSDNQRHCSSLGRTAAHVASEQQVQDQLRHQVQIPNAAHPNCAYVTGIQSHCCS